jgi:hypothetical protein
MSDPSNPWFLLQQGGYYSLSNSYCTGADVTAYLPRVEVHEGIRNGPVPGPAGYPPYNPPYSHVSLYKQIVANSNVQQKLEEILDYAPRRSPGLPLAADIDLIIISEFQANPQVQAQHAQWLDGPTAPGRAPIDCILRY